MRKAMLTRTIFVLSTFILLSGCASIVSKSKYPIYIRTNPPGVNVTITNRSGDKVYAGQSPAHITLKSGAGYFSKAKYDVQLSSPGFTDKTVTINYNINGWYFGNIIFGGIIGMLIVDPATGAMWKIKNPVIDEIMDKTFNAGLTQPTLNIIDIKDVSNELKTQLVKLD